MGPFQLPTFREDTGMPIDLTRQFKPISIAVLTTSDSRGRAACVISTGGTGLTGRDVTPEAFARVWDKEIPGFGELFRFLSYQSIGTSMVQSRACAGVASGTYLFALPGSPGAVKEGWDGILVTRLPTSPLQLR
jgi:molybdopterin adenylyltransferase